MSLHSFLGLSLLTLASVAQAQDCPLQFEGRVPVGTTPTAFDNSNTSLYNPSYNFGANLTWSQIIKFPTDIPTSLYDGNSTTPFEVTLSDASIFAPSSTNVQVGFRRAELLPLSNNGSDASTTGIKTLHFSIMKDASRPLNLSHEYQIAFLESADFSTNQFVLKTGTILGTNNTDSNVLRVVGNVNEGATELFTTAFTDGWHNFGLKLDFTANTTQVFYSTSSKALKSVTKALTNDISGQGQYHFGLLKKPTDFAAGADVSKNGFQESGINEGLIFGGIFMEDSENCDADVCVETE
ncbi:uncharacterized protein EAF01_006241 [Botrytis porri]|uniref:Glycoside hydrolase 131 catalytic N-terminal domain-containing protein n=1 Tax=Botrytis porri TaxID=87229 RepID=A0A4Z1KRF9_9HELO|nr:uncharacterized protein EAF01_006241 [Botrytis porri]KAF7903192.1 hypothetical protein EAF01_006241 [Botrytis porri]TGO84515.1 hypothetical protein BPOR_0495g00010 [Botrytis porri]